MCNAGSMGPMSSGLQLDMQCADRGGIINQDVDIIPDGTGCFWNVLLTSSAACPLGESRCVLLASVSPCPACPACAYLRNCTRCTPRPPACCFARLAQTHSNTSAHRP
jgi:hypothetical protein